jgi:hypothetical protein
MAAGKTLRLGAQAAAITKSKILDDQSSFSSIAHNHRHAADPSG